MTITHDIDEDATRARPRLTTEKDLPCRSLMRADPALFDRLFFPESMGEQRAAQRAKEICARCPVEAMEACSMFAAENGPVGVWGGELLVNRSKDSRRETRQRLAYKAGLRGADALRASSMTKLNTGVHDRRSKQGANVLFLADSSSGEFRAAGQQSNDPKDKA